MDLRPRGIGVTNSDMASLPPRAPGSDLSDAEWMIRVAGSFIYERVPSRLADVEMGPVDDAGMSRQAGFEVLPLRVT